MTARSHTRSRARLKRIRAERRRFELEQEAVTEVSLQHLAHRLVQEGKASALILGPIAIERNYR